MLITVTRTHRSADGIYGNLMIDVNPFKCVTLERLGLEISPATYDLVFMWSEKFQQIMPHVIVPGRTVIEIHWANYPKQLDGCTALGTENDFADDMITESQLAWIGFVRAITDQPALKVKYIEDYGV